MFRRRRFEAELRETLRDVDRIFDELDQERHRREIDFRKRQVESRSYFAALRVRDDREIAQHRREREALRRRLDRFEKGGGTAPAG